MIYPRTDDWGDHTVTVVAACCSYMLHLHHYIHFLWGSNPHRKCDTCKPRPSTTPSTATTLNPPTMKNIHGGLWCQRIAASIDTSLLLIKQQLCSRSSSSNCGDGGSGPSCMHTTLHIPMGAETRFTAFFPRCSQTLQTFPLSWEPRQDQHSAHMQLMQPLQNGH